MKLRRAIPITAHPRRGSTLPAYVIGILVAGGCLAWVLNQLWLSTARAELRTLAGAVALAAAQRLASDELLKADGDAELPAELAREQADQMLENDPLTKRAYSYAQRPQIDLRLGKVHFDPLTGDREEEETDEFPTSALVIAHRDHQRGNPVQVFLPYLMGRSGADVNISVEASITNHISGVHPPAVGAVPAWPIGVLEVSDDPRRPTWVRDIEERQGADDFAWDPETRQVLEESDGLREIVLCPRPKEGRGNAVIVDIGSRLNDDLLDRQFRDGWTATDLEPFGGQFSLKDEPIELKCSDDFGGMPESRLRAQIGQPRIIVLYKELGDAERDGTGKVQAERLAAGRIMDVRTGENGLEIVMQAAVVATRTAVLDEDALYRSGAEGNKYIYKLSLTQ